MEFEILPAESAHGSGGGLDQGGEIARLFAENRVSMITKMIEKALSGDIQAAKLLHQYYFNLLFPSEEKPDIIDLLNEDEADQ